MTTYTFNPPCFDSIPSELKNLPRWVVWRAVPQPDGKKPRKVPFNPRTGREASSVDPATWSAFSEAQTAYTERNNLPGAFTGVGFVVNNDGIGGVDLDDCVSPDGAIQPEAMAILEGLNCQYIEVSPSGSGLRGFGFADPLPSGTTGKVSGVSVELYTRARYLTLTGNTIKAGPLGPLVGFAALADRVRSERAKTPPAAAQSAAKKPARHAPAPAAHHAGSDTIEDLRSALAFMDADDYGHWVNMGMALKTLPGDRGRELWIEWSKTSGKWRESDALKWEGLDPIETGYKAVFDAAQKCGWTNPAKGKRTRKTTAVEDFEGGAQDITGPFPDMDGRPCYVVLNDWREHAGRRYMPGVYYCGIKDAKGDNPPTMFDAWFCSPLHIDAVTFDAAENNYGRLLRFKPTEGNKWREWAMPMELLAGDCSQLRGELLSMGVLIDHNKRTYLPTYLQSEHPKRRMHCALQVGWFDGSFVLPDVVIGPNAKNVIFQSGERGHEEHTRAGSLEGWQSGIAAKAKNNPLLTLAISASFAGPMLQRCNAEGGGVHIVGDSSTGKSTLMEAACATWGGPGFKRSWRSTANGMEGAAAMFNDCLLALDEISECDPKEVGAIVYALGNGRGKQRAGRSGAARGVTQWRCFVMSNGERSIATTMTEGGYRVKAGQSVRLLDIPAAETFGAWNDVHGATSPAAFSDGLKRAATKHHGHAGRAFLERLTNDSTDYCLELDKIKALPMFATDGTEGQDKRAAARFALIGMAGEVAAEYGVITGWATGDAIHAAAHAFKLWQRGRGKGNDERRQITEKLHGFIQRHVDSRFSNADLHSDLPLIHNRAGYWRTSGDGREFLFTAEGMREALKGFDFGRALDVLTEVGALPLPGADGKRTKFCRIFGMPMRLYPVNPQKLEGDEHGA